MSCSKSDLLGLLNSVELLVKNIKRKRNLVINHLQARKCLNSDQMCKLVNALVDQLLDDTDPGNSDQHLVRCLEEQRSQVVHHIKLEQELKFKNAELEALLKIERENLKRNQKQCGKLQNSLMISRDEHKEEIKSLQLAINQLRATNTQLSAQVTRLETDVRARTSIELMVTKIEGVKGETVMKKEVKCELADIRSLIVEETETRIRPVISASNPSVPGTSRVAQDEDRTTVQADDVRQSTTFTVVGDCSGSESSCEDSEPQKKCFKCGYYNIKRCQMARHKPLCKNRPPDFRCRFCGALYFTLAGLRLHYRAKH